MVGEGGVNGGDGGMSGGGEGGLSGGGMVGEWR